MSVGILLVVASYIGRFRETTDSENDLVTVGLWLGSMMVTLPLLAATIYGRLHPATRSQDSRNWCSSPPRFSCS